MRVKLARLLTVLGIIALITTVAASADENALVMRAKLSGLNEVPPKAEMGSGTFRATASDSAITYTLSYSGLSSTAHAAHIHFAQRGVNGTIFAFLCGGGGKPPCPDGSTGPGSVSGTITAADILAVPDQGIKAGDFATALRLIRSGETYVNVHTTNHPGGEIRGQVGSGESD